MDSGYGIYLHNNRNTVLESLQYRAQSIYIVIQHPTLRPTERDRPTVLRPLPPLLLSGQHLLSLPGPLLSSKLQTELQTLPLEQLSRGDARLWSHDIPHQVGWKELNSLSQRSFLVPPSPPSLWLSVSAS